MKIKFKYLYIFMILSVLLNGCGSGGGGGGGGSSSDDSNKNVTIPPEIKMDFKKSDTIVGVIDSSFSYLDEFKDPSGNYRIFIDDSFDADPQNRLNNTYTHGELVSLLIGGNKIGINDEVKIYAIPAFLTEGSQIKFQRSMYEKMYQAGVRIFSQSFGNSSYGITKENYPVASGIVEFYVNRASTDSLFIFAAGNTGDFNPTSEALLPKFYPKAEKGWLAVVGLDPSTGEIHRGSSRAGETMNWAITASFVANAEKVYNGVNYKTTAFGTSFAAPVVAGAAGAIQIKYPWMSRDLIKQSLLTTATDLGDPGVDSTYGWGYLNLGKALK
ncbi:S8 family serine peptidase, partial [Fusobacterium sp.]|uniref:S8 family serine peptidase n=1 Tax=Fusobacterium sp. TaxID=68766 RepID=UPI0028FDCBF8